jgi:hypothetical protein
MDGVGIQNNIIMTDKKKFTYLTKKHDFHSSIGYFGLCIILSFLLMSLTLFYFYYIVDGFMMNESLNQAILDSGSGVLGTMIGFLILNVLLVHLTTKIFGAKLKMQKTFQVNAYAYTPYFLFGWLWTLNTEGSPLEMAFLVLGFVFSLLSVINVISGLRYIHKLSTIKAVIAGFFIPLFAYMGLVILYMMYGSQYGLM